MPGHAGQNIHGLAKAFMMPRDEPLRAYVDGWLQRTAATGTLDAVFRKHLKRLLSRLANIRDPGCRAR